MALYSYLLLSDSDLTLHFPVDNRENNFHIIIIVIDIDRVKLTTSRFGEIDTSNIDF